MPAERASLLERILDFVERDFSPERRAELADTGAAMPDGSYPIANAADLENARQALGRATNRAAVEAHIRKRASALGITLPKGWPSESVTEADAPHLDMAGDVLRQHLADAHFKDRALLADAKNQTMQGAHVSAHNAREAAVDPAAVDETVPLVERKIGADGTIKVKLIGPGWGSSGYYSEEVLKRDGPRVWPAGTKMYADHPTLSEERDRPERSIKDIAATFTDAPVWEDDRVHGKGLYARAKVIDTWRPHIEALIGTIDASIRADGKGAQGEAEGRRGVIVQELTRGRSVDFVTTGGAGGKIIGLAESARSRQEEDGMADQKLEEVIRERDDFKARALRAEEAIVVVAARGRAAARLKDVAIPDATKARLAESVSANPPVRDGKLDEAAFDAKLVEAAKAEAKYLADLGVGAIRGVGEGDGGAGADGDPAKLTESLATVFAALGMSEAEAKVAARGRN